MVGIECHDAVFKLHFKKVHTLNQGGNSWGGGHGGGGAVPPNFWPTTLFSVFSHTTDRKIPSEVVLMGSFMSVIYGNVR